MTLLLPTGTLMVLIHPYPRKVEEPSIYESVRVHTAMQTGRTENDLVPSAPSLGTKEGYLTKQGGLVKTWKTRWFTLHRNELKYFKDQMVRTVMAGPPSVKLLSRVQGALWAGPTWNTAGSGFAPAPATSQASPAVAPDRVGSSLWAS